MAHLAGVAMTRSFISVIGVTVFAAAIALSANLAHSITLTDTVVVDGAPVGFGFSTDGTVSEYPVEFMTDTTAGSLGGSAGAFTMLFESSPNVSITGITLEDAGGYVAPVTTNPILPTTGSLLFSANVDISASTSNLWTLTFFLIDSSPMIDFVTGNIYASSVVPTPIPAALPLFAAALAGIGFFGWRRNRQTN